MDETQPDLVTSAVTREVNRQLLLYQVQSVMFCRYSGAVLDKRRAVLLSLSNGKDYIMTAAHFDKHRDDIEYMLATHPSFEGVTCQILDGRELWK